MCPNENESKKFMIFNESLSIDKKFATLCSQRRENHMNIAFNNDPPMFHLVNNTMKERPLLIETGSSNSLPSEEEIMSLFFDHNNIVPHWINCNYTWGWLDTETGHWTGAVGQVQIIRNT